jgi:AcrR family transcriptional regulator
MPDSDTSQERERMVAQLYSLLRRTGYQGVTMEEIASATGVDRPSLDAQFPGGKPEIAEAVLEFARSWVRDRIIAALRQDAPLQRRLEDMLSAVQELYAGGKEPCIVASMMVGAKDQELNDALSGLLLDWLGALRSALIDHGMEPEAAASKAAAIVSRIEGGLLLARALETPRLFSEALDAARNEIWV